METEIEKSSAVEAGEPDVVFPVTRRPKRASLAWRILKWVLWSVAGLFVFILVAALTLPLWIDPVGTLLADALVPKYTGTEFNVDRINLNPYTGKLNISGVKLANPEGYDEKYAFTLGSLSADVEVSTLLSDTIHVREITIDSPYASYVFDAEGVNNLDRIIATVNEKLGPKKKKKKEDKGETKVLIDKITIKNVRAAVGNGAFELESLTLADFGKDDKPAQIEISGVRLVNPDGFGSQADNAFSLGSLSAGVDTADMGELPIKLHDVVIDSLYASYVFDEQNVNNFTRMLEPLLTKGGESEKKEKGKEKTASSVTPVTIDRLELKNLKAQISKGRFELASLEVTDFGKPTAAMIKLENAKLVNPEGFPEPNAFTVSSINIGMETADLSKKPIVFHDILVASPSVFVVYNDAGEGNFDVIFMPLKGKGKNEGDKESKKKDDDVPAVVIDKLQITGTELQYRSFAIPKALIPDPFIKNDIGKESKDAFSLKGLYAKVEKGIKWMESVWESLGGVLEKINPMNLLK